MYQMSPERKIQLGEFYLTERQVPILVLQSTFAKRIVGLIAVAGALWLSGRGRFR